MGDHVSRPAKGILNATMILMVTMVSKVIATKVLSKVTVATM
jgi:hypothetical protein